MSEVEKMRAMIERPGSLLTAADLLEEVVGPTEQVRYRIDVRFGDNLSTSRRMGSACIVQGISLLRVNGIPADTIRALVETALSVADRKG